MSLIATRADRERIQFRLLPDLPYGLRMPLAAAAAAVGLVLQLQNVPFFLVVGTLFVFAGILVTLVKSKSNAPGKLSGEKTWERVTEDEFRRVETLQAAGAKWARKDAFGAFNLLGCGTFLLLALALVVGRAVVVSAAADRAERNLYSTVWFIDGGLFLFLTFIAGTRKTWQPGDLLIKIKALGNILALGREHPVPILTFQPMFEVQKDKQGRQLPTDARILVTVKDGPADLIGIQVQCSINRVQSTAYPYLYCVIIARKAFDLPAKMQRATVGKKEVLTIEQKDPEVDVAVIRQQTSKTSGYNTSRDDQLRIFQQTANIAVWLAQNP